VARGRRRGRVSCEHDHWRRIGIPERYFSADFQRYGRLFDEHAERWRVLSGYHDHVAAAMGRHVSLLLVGRGIGKTGIAVELVKRVDGLFRGSAWFADAEDFLSADGPVEDDCSSVPFLVVDNMQEATMYRPYETRRLRGLVDYRSKAMLVTVVTSSVESPEMLPIHTGVDTITVLFEPSEYESRLWRECVDFFKGPGLQ